jgi:hypothetical protein
MVSLLWGIKGFYNSHYIFDYWCNDLNFITKDSSSSPFIVVTIIILVMLLQRTKLLMVAMIIVIVFVIIIEIVHVVIVFLSLHLKANLYKGSKIQGEIKQFKIG